MRILEELALPEDSHFPNEGRGRRSEAGRVGDLNYNHLKPGQDTESDLYNSPILKYIFQFPKLNTSFS